MATTEADARSGLRVKATPGLLFVKLGKVAHRWLSEELKALGLTPWHAGTLYGLSQRSRSQQYLVDAVGLDASKLVGVLNDLEGDGLVIRRRDPADRRRHIVEISHTGRSRLEAAEGAVRTVEARLLAGLDDAERAQLLHLLRRIAGNAGLEHCVELGGVAQPEGVAESEV